MKRKNNKSKWLIIIFLIVVAIILVSIFVWNTYFYQPYSSNNYEAQKTSYNSNNNNKDNSNKNESTSKSDKPTITEEEIGTFSTKIYSTDTARQNNINITCSKLNDTIVANTSTFSFCNTVGPANTNEGYLKADIFDANGNKKKGLGGGNCQISTTLYNAILPIPNIEITEKHQHSNYVPYIQKGRDAAVAYGSYDLKFVNSTGHDIKIKALTDSKVVTVSIIKLIRQ